MTNPKPVYLAFDTETSTGDKRTAFILSLGAMVLDKDLQVIDKIKLLIKPDPQPNGQDGTLVVEPEAMGVNKIDLVAHFKDPETLPLSEACVKFSEFMFKYVDFKRVPIGNPRFGKTKFVCKNPLIPVGQNYRFDKEVITWTLLREFEACVTNRGIDTGSNGEFLRLCGLLPTVGGLSLSKQAELAGVMQELVNKAHDALVDTELSVWVLQWQKSMVTRLAAVEPPAPSKPVVTPEALKKEVERIGSLFEASIEKVSDNSAPREENVKHFFIRDPLDQTKYVFQEGPVNELRQENKPTPTVIEAKPVIKYTAWAQEWTYRDSWSGPESEGFYLYLQEDIARAKTTKRLLDMRKEEAKTNGGRVPECYSVPEGQPFEVRIPEELWQRLSMSEHGEVHAGNLQRVGVERVGIRLL